MTEEITRLANGLTVITHTMPHLETTSLGIWVGVGSRHERADENGISHFLEHMSFKGTASRTAQAIAEEIEAVGGELNAATGLETTAYFARVLKGDEGVALELLADILLNSRFLPDELEREREVILQEIAGTRDMPEDIAFELVNDAAYPGQPIGRTILGPAANVRRFTPADLSAFLKRHYKPQRMVLSAAGATQHAPLVRHAEALFGRLTQDQGAGEEPAQYHGGVRWRQKRFEQSHLALAFEGPSYRDNAYFTAQVFSGLFGGGMSSRLFQEAREKRGLCYSIYSSAWGLGDTGLLAVHAATGTELMASLIDVTGAELEDVAGRGPSAAELNRAKAQLKAGLLISLESSSARAEQMARHMLAHGRIVGSDELIRKVDDVSVEDVALFAQGLTARRPSVAVVGAGKASERLASEAAQRMGRGSVSSEARTA
ncbi:pitrilysin family protein [Hyphomicrobium sp.]|uniref:M16 family metallopeptidase n=1 Tax=Hyphomicrobium sp. TaxID=82 RepID=UPI0025B95979|nr:pitrilysin family protein [Hyphomicrobium sp.]MCC7252204.1 insulinase family protein [Hyphomicrobium sp.]